MEAQLSDSESSTRSMKFHADREMIVAEPHARPPLAVSSRDFIVYLGFTCSDEGFAAIVENLQQPPEAKNQRHLTVDVNGFRVKLERHTEFYSLTLLADSKGKKQKAKTFLTSILPETGVEVIVFSEVVLCATSGELIKSMPFGERIYGGKMRGNLEVRSTLKPDADGAIVYAVQSSGSTPDETGRRIQRLLEMETYRTMCLLGLSTARRTGEMLASAENRLNAIVKTMTTGSRQDDETLYDQLLALAQDCTNLQAETRFRFSASKAYFDLAQQRISSLEEEKSSDLQTISGFVRSRLDPGMATIESTAARQATLYNDLSNALSLLRTRIDLGLNRDNQALLQSMDQRQKQQVVIAQTVEGLSAIAISYYLIGLLSYMIKGYADYLPFDLTPKTVIAIAVPFVVIAVWGTLHRIRKKWEEKSG